tara:strand:- start:419 stop:811 length:393 start_codon:yes stop_codon:yes gene_type:complete
MNLSGNKVDGRTTRSKDSYAKITHYLCPKCYTTAKAMMVSMHKTEYHLCEQCDHILKREECLIANQEGLGKGVPKLMAIWLKENPIYYDSFAKFMQENLQAKQELKDKEQKKEFHSHDALLLQLIEVLAL